jgi:hypothetical protein
MSEKNHDALVRHECEIGELKEQSCFILKRLDEQDAKDVAIKDELIKKIEESKSKFNDAMWAIALLIISATIGGFIYALIFK